MRILLFFIIFFLIGALLIISNNNLLMSEKKNVAHFTELYIDWMNKIYVNLQSITGNAVKLGWFPTANSSG